MSSHALLQEAVRTAMKRSAPVDDDDVTPKRQNRFPVQHNPASSVSAAVPPPKVIDLTSDNLVSDGIPYGDDLDDGPEHRTFRDLESDFDLMWSLGLAGLPGKKKMPRKNKGKGTEQSWQLHYEEMRLWKWGYSRSPSCGCKGRCGNPFYRMSEIFTWPEGTPATETRPHDCFVEWFRHESLSHPEHTTLEYIFETIYASLREDDDLGLQDTPTSWKDRWDAAGVADRDASDPEKREMMRELVRMGCGSKTSRKIGNNPSVLGLWPI
ncbi:hypothetical protein QQZ08_000470 [Neonectria magnoliae]|uniref:Uncharacterized protein n=1 Tax=Neonectria magnoliae TaxID=2732573 RepID=A0ABR1IHE5_9HYPO